MPATSPRLLSERVYRRIREDLLVGNIRPGDRITEEWAAGHYQTSRTPIREACRRLAQEGLLVHRPRQGFTAPMLDLAEVEHLYEMREALESLAIRGACRAELRDSLQLLEADWGPGAPPLTLGADMVFKDEEFHLTIARTAGNPPLVAVLESINARIRLIRVHDFLDQERVEATLREHRAMFAAVLARDESAAEALLRSHIAESRRYLGVATGRALTELLSGRSLPTPARTAQAG